MRLGRNDRGPQECTLRSLPHRGLRTILSQVFAGPQHEARPDPLSLREEADPDAGAGRQSPFAEPPRWG